VISRGVSLDVLIVRIDRRELVGELTATVARGVRVTAS
jgi:hypothetical protein